MLSFYCTALSTKRFEPPHSLTTCKKKLGHTASINIWTCDRKFSEKNCFLLPFYCTMLRTGCPKDTEPRFLHRTYLKV